jgi:glutamate synthase (NADPH/NADH) small chain
MADPKGFLKNTRRELPRRPVQERVRDWGEVYTGQELLPVIGAQAGRCMDCGIPFCHDACPLGNLIPEWNDLAHQDAWEDAAERLHATNNFPDFTGRLCPAPCESACVLAINQPAVTIKNIEVAIADYAWRQGLAAPRPPERLSGRTVAVIGSGPAGLACAQQLTRAGHTVAVYERDDRLGGLLRYGIPEFKMEKRHLDRRLAQMRAEGTKFRTGVAVGRDQDAAELVARYDAAVVAAGATAPRELAVPGRELAGVHQAMEYLVQANRVCEGDYDRPPVSAEGRHVVIVGGGDTGADCLGTVLRQGAASVVQLDINPLPAEERPAHEPWPVYPKVFRVSPAHEEARVLARRDGWEAEGQGLPLPGPDGDVRVFSASTLRFTGDAGGHVRELHLVGVEPERRRPQPGTERVIPADLVLLALGFSGPERDNGLVDQLGLTLDARGTIARDADYATGVPGVFAAGDAGRGQSLIVWAIAEGRSAAASVDRYLTGTTALPAPVRPADRPLVA